jgi:hypothetical protein
MRSVRSLDKSAGCRAADRLASIRRDPRALMFLAGLSIAWTARAQGRLWRLTARARPRPCCRVPTRGLKWNRSVVDPDRSDRWAAGHAGGGVDAAARLWDLGEGMRRLAARSCAPIDGTRAMSPARRRHPAVVGPHAAAARGWTLTKSSRAK